MPRRNPLVNPLNKLKDTALGAVKDPKRTSERLVGQAKGAATVGRHVAEGIAGQVVEQVNARTRRRRASDAPRAASAHHPVPAEAPSKTHGDPIVPTPKTTAPSAEAPPTTHDGVEARKATPADVAKKASKKAPPKKAAAKKSAKKATKKAPAKKTAPGDRLPPRATAKPTPPPAPGPVEPNPEATPPGSTDPDSS